MVGVTVLRLTRSGSSIGKSGVNPVSKIHSGNGSMRGQKSAGSFLRAWAASAGVFLVVNLPPVLGPLRWRIQKSFFVHLSCSRRVML